MNGLEQSGNERIWRNRGEAPVHSPGEGQRGCVRWLMRQAHEQGTPLMRAMSYAFPEDPACATLSRQYMFGNRCLVAPVLEPGTRSVSVYLPAGAWRDANNGEVPEGGRTIGADAPLERIPVFERL